MKTKLFRSTSPLLWYYVLPRQLIPQGNDQISWQKWPLRSPKDLCGKFHIFMKKYTIWQILGATPLY